jgi:hypothetical protein
VPPRTKALSASLRTPRVGLVRRMHPGVEGDAPQVVQAELRARSAL